MNQWSTGVTIADVNGDGWLDIFVCQVGNYKFMKGKNRLFMNDANKTETPTFTDKTTEYGLDFSGFSTQAAFFDYDADGLLDMYLLNHSVHEATNYVKGDIRETSDIPAGDKLYHNVGGRFVEVTTQQNIFNSKIGYGLGVAMSDLDNNGLTDIYIGNDFHEMDYCYLNQKDAPFKMQSERSFGHHGQFSMGNDVADINNDGRPDILTLDMKPESEIVRRASVGADPYNIFEYKRKYGYHYQYPRNMLNLNRGNFDGIPFFSEIGQLAGIDATDWSWTPLIADFDLDGHKDVFISNGIVRRPNDLDYLRYISSKEIQSKASDLELIQQMPSGAMPNYFYKNNGNLQFENVSCKWSNCNNTLTTGAAYADLDNDGDLDLVLNNVNAKATILQNTINGSHLKVVLNSPNTNSFGNGAKVTLFQNGNLQFLEKFPTRGFMSCTADDLLFGVKNSIIDSVKVVWSDGTQTKLGQIEPNQTLNINKGARKPLPKDEQINKKKLFTDVTKSLIDWSHYENKHFDVNHEKLLPKLLSTRGPAMAFGDVTGNGLDDVFLGGALKQPWTIFQQEKNGTFKYHYAPQNNADNIHEDVSAAIFDVNQDKDQDLLIISAGNQSSAINANEDRLFLNKGNGKLQRSPQQMPNTQGSVIATHDFNNDGLMDYFLGNHNITGQYGITPESILFENKGSGRFSKTNLLPNNGKVGMINDAKWADLDGNGHKDLVLAGDWMSITVLYFDGNQFTLKEISNSKGFWNCIALADLDQDGDVDIIAGNIGANHEFKVDNKFGMVMRVGDFNEDKILEPFISFPGTFLNDRLLASKDELAKQMPQINKTFTNYQQFAKAPSKEIISRDKAQETKVVKMTKTAIFKNGEGGFLYQPLPLEANFSTTQDIIVHDFDGDNQLDILLGGNFHEFIPTIGRMDASIGTLLKGNGKLQFTALPNDEINLKIDGQVRQMKYMKLANGDEVILIAKNNAPLQILKINQTN